MKFRMSLGDALRLYELYMSRGIDMYEHRDGVPSMHVDPFLTWNLQVNHWGFIMVIMV